MPVSSSDNRGKWRRKPRDSKPTNSKRQRLPEDEDDDEEEDNTVYADEDEDLHPNPKKNINPNSRPAAPSPRSEPAPARGGEVMVDGVRISEFPVVVRRVVNRPHPSVGTVAAQNGVVLENVSYGQLQALSAVPAENAALAMAGDQDSMGLYVISPPSIMEGRGVVKKFWNGRVHVVPMHADWFCPTRVHRLERQVVPRFFSGKSVDHTPEKYMDCRNMIASKYMEQPEKRLSIRDCHGMIVGVDVEDMTRIFRFLEHWGIINYCAPVSDREYLNMESCLREDVSGEVHVPSAALKSIDSLIKFDKPKCRLKAEDVYSLFTSKGDDAVDLENRIWEKLSENHCNSCSQPLLQVYYQSVKEADIMLCPDCYHEGKFVIGHSSMDFTKADSANDYTDVDGDSWSDQETLMLLEAVEIYHDNWNDIAEHVGSKSKAQCIVHFLRLPVEDGLLSNLEVPQNAEVPRFTNEDANNVAYLNSNGNSSGSCIQDSDSDHRLPFANSGNPVMSLVAFLASSVGPRVAAACAHASLAALSDGDGLSPSESTLQADGSVRSDRTIPNDGPNGDVRDSAHYKDENASRSQNNAQVTPLSAKKVEFAAKAGLAAAAVKAKLFADHEEREIQRLSANIINHQCKVYLQRKNHEGAITQMHALSSCADFTVDFLFLAVHEAVASRALSVAVASLSSLLNFYSSGKPMPVSEVVVLRTLITILLEEPGNELEILKFMKKVQARAIEVGPDNFFGKGETGRRESNWIALNSWNLGTKAGTTKNYQLCAEFMRLAFEFYSVRIDEDVDENNIMVCKAIILTVSAMIADENQKNVPLQEAEVKHAIELLDRAGKILSSTSSGNKLTDGQDNTIGPDLHFIYTLNCYELYGRLKDSASQNLIVKNFVNSKSCNPTHLLHIGVTASQGPCFNLEVATFTLTSCLSAFLSSPAPDYQNVGLAIRKLIIVAGLYKCETDDETVYNLYKQAYRIMVGLKEGEFPGDEAKWLAITAWNRASCPLRLGHTEAAKKWMALALDLAMNVPGMESYKSTMEEFIGEFEKKSQMQ